VVCNFEIIKGVNMKGIVCKVCGYIAIDGSAPDKCPVCGAPKTAFSEKEDAIKTPQDVKNKTELEKKHVPVILINKNCSLIPGCVDVHAKMGDIIHPMLKEHHIVSMDFYLDKGFIARVHLTPEKLNPAAGLHLKVSSETITVISYCNLHGSWINEVKI